MKIGYKGFDKNLKCKDYQFYIGVTAVLPEKENPRICSNDGFHYCNKLEDVFSYYDLKSKNRFCEVEILGNFTDGTFDNKDKSITTSLKPIREISEKEIFDIKLKDRMNLDLVKDLQTKYPILHVGGSIGLFLHGIRLKRWAESHQGPDLDLVSPYFILPEPSDDLEIQYIDAKASCNDFDETFLANGIKVDYRVDNKQRYVIKEFEGFKYKVSTFETIMAAKMRYAQKGQSKHKEDIREICGLSGKD